METIRLGTVRNDAKVWVNPNARPNSMFGWMADIKGIDAYNYNVLKKAYSITFLLSLTASERDALAANVTKEVTEE